MKEKTYYNSLEAQLDLGEKCLKGIKALESENTIKRFQSLVYLNGKRYEITITKWKELENGIDKV
jgi:hypothetical protein